MWPQATSEEHGQHFIFCSVGHSELNSHFKKLNTSNIFLTGGSGAGRTTPTLVGPKILSEPVFRSDQ